MGPSDVVAFQVKRLESLSFLYSSQLPLYYILFAFITSLFCPTVRMMSTNIVLFGEAGVGKSSVINLIAGKDVAKMSPDGWECTLDFKHYQFEVVGRTFNIWETIGLGRCLFSTVEDCLGVIEKAYALIRQIRAEGGLHLLLFCIPESLLRIPPMVINYRLFFNVLCNGQVPIALIVTHSESVTEAAGWWSRNNHCISTWGLQFSKHARVTSPVHPHSAEHREALVDILLEYEHCHPMPPAFDWFSGFLERLHVIPCPEELKNNPSKLERRLCDRCMLAAADANQLAEKFSHSIELSPLPEGYRSRTGENSSFNIVLFGETGVGKSSVVNLIADKEVADISPDVAGCTMSVKEYSFEIAGRTFNIWDTVGLGEPSFRIADDLGAIEKTYDLIQQIEAKGGLDLLLFCIPGSRITATMECNYRLFYEVLCEKRIPISVVVTRLEREQNLMEDWWRRNKEEISKSDLKFSGHACVTGLVDDPRKAGEGRFALELLLMKFDGKGCFLMPPAPDWFAGFLERLANSIPLNLPRLLKMKQSRKELKRLLCSRCNMDRARAKQLAENVIRIRNQSR